MGLLSKADCQGSAPQEALQLSAENGRHEKQASMATIITPSPTGSRAYWPCLQGVATPEGIRAPMRTQTGSRLRHMEDL